VSIQDYLCHNIEAYTDEDLNLQGCKMVHTANGSGTIHLSVTVIPLNELIGT